MVDQTDGQQTTSAELPTAYQASPGKRREEEKESNGYKGTNNNQEDRKCPTGMFSLINNLSMSGNQCEMLVLWGNFAVGHREGRQTFT